MYLANHNDIISAHEYNLILTTWNENSPHTTVVTRLCSRAQSKQWPITRQKMKRCMVHNIFTHYFV